MQKTGRFWTFFIKEMNGGGQRRHTQRRHTPPHFKRSAALDGVSPPTHGIPVQNSPLIGTVSHAPPWVSQNLGCHILIYMSPDFFYTGKGKVT